MVVWDQTEPSCLYNHDSVVRLFVYRSSLQKVFLQKDNLKNAATLAAREQQWGCVL